jgi:hypothetical protein
MNSSLATSESVISSNDQLHCGAPANAGTGPVLHSLIVDDRVGEKGIDDIRQCAVIDCRNKRVNGGSEFGCLSRR